MTRTEIIKHYKSFFGLEKLQENNEDYLKIDWADSLLKDNGVLVDVNERNIAKYDYVWYNERLCKVTDMREWSKKDKGIRVEVLDLDNRKSFTVAISSLRYVR